MTGQAKIEQRRRDVWALHLQQLTESEIAEALKSLTVSETDKTLRYPNISQPTVSRDLRFMMRKGKKFIDDLAKDTLPYFYQRQLDTLDQIAREAWFIVNDGGASRRDRLNAMNILKDIEQTRFNLLQEGSTVHAVKALQQRVETLTKELEARVSGQHQTQKAR